MGFSHFQMLTKNINTVISNPFLKMYFILLTPQYKELFMYFSTTDYKKMSELLLLFLFLFLHFVKATRIRPANTGDILLNPSMQTYWLDIKCISLQFHCFSEFFFLGFYHWNSSWMTVLPSNYLGWPQLLAEILYKWVLPLDTEKIVRSLAFNSTSLVFSDG